MRYEVEPDGTLRILEDDKPAPEPRKPSGPHEPRGTGVSFMAVAHHVCHALVVLAIVLGIVAGLLSPLGLWGTISTAASRGWASLLYHLSKLDILYGPRWLLQRVVSLSWDGIALWLIDRGWATIQYLWGLLLELLSWAWGLLADLLGAIF